MIIQNNELHGLNICDNTLLPQITKTRTKVILVPNLNPEIKETKTKTRHV